MTVSGGTRAEARRAAVRVGGVQPEGARAAAVAVLSVYVSLAGARSINIAGSSYTTRVATGSAHFYHATCQLIHTAHFDLISKVLTILIMKFTLLFG